jgi:hypothetical protein
MEVILSIFGPTTPGEDAQAVAANLRKTGCNSLLFFTSLYTGYRLIQRRYPNRAIYSLETDRLFYEPDRKLYEGCTIQPQRSLDDPKTDHLASLSRACKAEGIRFIPLVPICAGQRIVQDHPELAVKNLYGAADRLFLCYNHPQVRKYRAAMVRDVVSRYDIGGLCLDKIPQTMLEQNGFGGMLFDPPLRTVGSFCFCEHCKTRAQKSGLDLEEVRRRALEIANRSSKIPPHVIEAQREKLTGDTEIPLLLLEEPLIEKMLQFRFESAVELVGELRGLVRQLKPQVKIQAAFVPPSHFGHDSTSPRAWLTVQSYKKYAGVLDEVLCVVHYGQDVVRFETERAVAAAEGKLRVITSMRLYGATRPEEVAQLGEAALAGGSDGVSFLGYDVATDELLASLGKWVRTKH